MRMKEIFAGLLVTLTLTSGAVLAQKGGDKLPPLKDLAVTTSVNPNTVIKALG